MNFKGLTIGIPREIMEHEKRVAAMPETVKKMTDEGARVIIEKDAGAGSFFSDSMYKEAGAEILEDPEKIYQTSDILMKVKEPIFNKDKNKHEVSMMRKGMILVSFLHPASPVNHQMVQDLAKQGVVSLTLDGIPRITKAQPMDALTSMSTVAGYKGVLLAADHLNRFLPMISTAVGPIQPSQVFVIGTGVAGLQALATAKRLGANVVACDIRPEAAEHAKSLGAKIVDAQVPPDKAIGEGGYAKDLPPDIVAREREALKETIIKSDIVILCALVPGRIAPILIDEDMVKQMKPGSVIVDISIDQGGNCALTEFGETVVKHGVTILGIKNIPGAVATSSTWMFAKNIYNFICHFVKDSKIKIDVNDEIIKSALVTIDGRLVHRGALEAIGAK